jgi:hypothetical protein
MEKERPREIPGAVAGIGAKQVAMIDTFHSHRIVAKPELPSTFAMSIDSRYEEKKRLNIGEYYYRCRLCRRSLVGLTSRRESG